LIKSSTCSQIYQLAKKILTKLAASYTKMYEIKRLLVLRATRSYPMGTKHILIVEDNAIAAQVAKFLFEALGCTVELVDDGEKAVRIADEVKFDAICMDIGLPSLSGIEACKLIREQEAKNNIDNVPIIAVTGNSSPEERQEYLAASMQEVIIKPITKEKAEHFLTFCK